MRTIDRKLVLEDGSEYYGYGFGSCADRVCEIVFNTSMSGYQEIVSDLSYTDQMVVMTYPLIGNYGMAEDDYECKFPSIGGIVCYDYNDTPSNFRWVKTLSELLEEYGIPGISGIDTRKLTRSIRDLGSRRVLITSAETGVEEALGRIADTPVPKDAVSRVSCKKRWYSRTADAQFHVVAVDCGIKLNIIRSLNHWGCNVTIVPYDTTAEEILAANPDGIMLSNGPGDPKECVSIIKEIKKLYDSDVPIFAICLGHQLMALATGADTHKMKYGHRGANHPVKDLQTGKVYISSQNHGYVVDMDTLDDKIARPAFINVNDKTNEGLEYVGKNIFTVQFHPEACAGPKDSDYLFDRFMNMMKKGRD